MTNAELAIAYIERFCAGDIDGLAPLLAADLQFTGPLHRYRTRAEYLDGLRHDPPQPCRFEVLSLTEGADAVAIFYEYHKPAGLLRIAQLFRIENQTIKDILLVFDSNAVT